MWPFKSIRTPIAPDPVYKYEVKEEVKPKEPISPLPEGETHTLDDIRFEADDKGAIRCYILNKWQFTIHPNESRHLFLHKVQMAVKMADLADPEHTEAKILERKTK